MNIEHGMMNVEVLSFEIQNSMFDILRFPPFLEPGRGSGHDLKTEIALLLCLHSAPRFHSLITTARK